MIIIILGPPASGKGTQAKILAEKLNLKLVETGRLARRLANENPRLKEIIDSGGLIPHAEMSMYVIEELSKNYSKISDLIFDGFPRFIQQYEALEEYLKTKGDDIDYVFNLKLSEDEAVKRIMARRICSNCGQSYNLITNPPVKENTCDACGHRLIQRADDNLESIKVRFQKYNENTKELTDYLRDSGRLIEIDASQEIEKINADMLNYLKSS